MPKNATPEVIEKVKRALDETPRSINEIAERADTDWATTQRWLEILRSLGYAHQKVVGSHPLFFVKHLSSSRTLFDIPISQTDEKVIHFIYAKAQELWKKKTNSSLGKSHAQKIVARVNKELDLKLPVGWYLYGQVCVLPYDDAVTYESVSFSGSEKMIAAIEKAVEDFIPLTSTKKLRKYHYEENHNELYLLKEQVIECRSFSFDAEHIEKLIRILLDMIPLLPKSNRELIQFFTDFIGETMDVKKTVSSAEHSFDAEKVMRIKRLFFDGFDAIWRLIAIESYKSSLMETGKFSKELLEEKFRIQYAAQDDLTIVLMQELSDEAEIEKLYYVDVDKLTDVQKKLRAMMGSARPLTPEEKKVMADRWDDPVERSKILREFGFD